MQARKRGGASSETDRPCWTLNLDFLPLELGEKKCLLLPPACGILQWQPGQTYPGAKVARRGDREKALNFPVRSGTALLGALFARKAETP